MCGGGGGNIPSMGPEKREYNRSFKETCPVEDHESRSLGMQVEKNQAKLYREAAKLAGLGFYEVKTGGLLPGGPKVDKNFTGVVISPIGTNDFDTFWTAFHSLENVQPKD